MKKLRRKRYRGRELHAAPDLDIPPCEQHSAPSPARPGWPWAHSGRALA